MSDDLRERVARAIYDLSWMYDRTKPWTLAPQNEKRLCYEMADAALAEIGGVRMKPLVWGESIGQISYFSASFIGEYRVTKTRNIRNDKWQVTYLDPDRRSHMIGYIEGFEPAKAAAQADYEARILAAIEPAPVSVRGAARVLLGHTPKITAKPLAEMSEAMKIDAHPAILLRGFCAALRAIAEGEE